MSTLYSDDALRALDVMTLPATADPSQLHRLVRGWSAADYAQYIAMSQVVIEAMEIRFGTSAVQQVLHELRRLAHSESSRPNRDGH